MPEARVIPVIGHQPEFAYRRLTKLATAIFIKALYSLVIAVVLAVSAALTSSRPPPAPPTERRCRAPRPSSGARMPRHGRSPALAATTRRQASALIATSETATPRTTS
jgi:hypothetical protein